MPYALTRTHHYLHVAEQQYAIAKKVRFTNLNSCVGLAGRRADGRVVGVHLVVLGQNSELFDGDAANRAAALVQDCEEVMIVGPYTIWEDNVRDAFRVLTQSVNPNLVFQDRPRGLQFSVSHGRLRYRLNAGRWCSCFG